MKWQSKVIHIDIDTGEILPGGPTEINKYYSLIKTTSHASINEKQTLGITTYTKQYRKKRYKQLELEL